VSIDGEYSSKIFNTDLSVVPGDLYTIALTRPRVTCRRYSQMQDNLIRQRQVDKAAQNTRRGVDFATHKPPPGSKAPEIAPAGTIAGYSGPAPMDLTTGKGRIVAEQRVNRFAYGRCVYCGGFNNRVAECAARQQAETCKVAGVEVKKIGTLGGSEESGRELVDQSKMVFWLTEKDLFQIL
jgi:hypothetical protein